jgi:GxxExxY protein
MPPLRIPSPLPDDLERVVERIIGACIAVHVELGPGLLEATYSKAIAAELAELAISFELECSFPVIYKGVVIGYHRLDLLIEGQIVVEVKAVERLLPVHVAQTICYLKVSKARVGLLMNFNAEVLRSGLRRIVL